MMIRIFIFLVTLSSFFYARATTEEEFKIHTSASICSIKEMVQGLKTSIQKDDMETFSKFVAYKHPARWNKKGKTVLIKTRKFFLNNHKKILTQKLKDAILNIEDELSNLFVNSHGIMVGNGEIWFDPARGGIFAFNSLIIH